MPLTIPDYLQTLPPRNLQDAELAVLIKRSQRGTWLLPGLVILVAMGVFTWLILSYGRPDRGALLFTLSVMFALGVVLPWWVTRPRRQMFSDLLQWGQVYHGTITRYRIGSQYVATRLTVEFTEHDQSRRATVTLPVVRGRFCAGIPVLVLVSEKWPGQLVMVAEAGSRRLQGFAGWREE